jgi:hypothetical protein
MRPIEINWIETGRHTNITGRIRLTPVELMAFFDNDSHGDLVVSNGIADINLGLLLIDSGCHDPRQRFRQRLPFRNIGHANHRKVAPHNMDAAAGCISLAAPRIFYGINTLPCILWAPEAAEKQISANKLAAKIIEMSQSSDVNNVLALQLMGGT